MGFHLKKADCLHVCWRHGPENGGPYLNGLNPPTALLILKKKKIRSPFAASVPNTLAGVP